MVTHQVKNLVTRNQLRKIINYIKQMNIPTKPIKTIYVGVSGDPSVGIPSRTYTLECYVDCNLYAPEFIPELLADIKHKTQALYTLLDGESGPSVMFDYEYEETKFYKSAKESSTDVEPPSGAHNFHD